MERRSAWLPLGLSIAMLAGLMLMTASARAQAPKIVCDQPGFDFGARPEDQNVLHTFVIRNAGAAMLIIDRVTAGCGCTVTQLSRREVPPGERAELRANLSLKGFRGVQRKGMVVHSNDPQTPRYNLWMTGTVISELSLEPAHVNFGRLLPKDERITEVRLTGLQEREVSILDVHTDSSLIRLERKVDDQGVCKSFLVGTSPPLPAGPLKATVLVRTDHQQYPSLSLNVNGLVLSEVRVLPSELILRGQPGDTVQRAVLLLPGSADTYRVLSVDVPSPGTQVAVYEQAPGTYRIAFTNLKITTELDGKDVLIKTDLSKMAEIRIPIRVSP